MILKSVLKKLFWSFLDIMLILFVLPFGFVMAFYFHLFFTGRNRIDLFLDLSEYSFKISWVSCTFLFLISLVLRMMIRNRKRWYALFAVSFAGGGFWLIVLNFMVESEFTFWRSLLPLTICCVISTGYALGKALYNDDSWNFADEPQLDYHENEREYIEEPEEKEESGENEMNEANSGFKG